MSIKQMLVPQPANIQWEFQTAEPNFLKVVNMQKGTFKTLVCMVTYYPSLPPSGGKVRRRLSHV